MPISKEQAVEIKKQLLSQIDKLQTDNKEELKAYVKDLNETDLEEFLKQNKIKYNESGSPSGTSSESTSSKKSSDEPECIFCSIVKGQIPSYNIYENNKAKVILELNPLTKGHSIVVPKNHGDIEDIPKSALTIAQKIAKKIKKKFKAEDVKIESSSFQGHAIINIIPFYKGEQVQKKKAEEKELKAIQQKLEVRLRKKRKKDSSEKKVENKPEKPLPKVSFRIP